MGVEHGTGAAGWLASARRRRSLPTFAAWLHSGRIWLKGQAERALVSVTLPLRSED
jgi:hypothetical protein